MPMSDEVYRHQVNLERLKAQLVREYAQYFPELREYIKQRFAELDADNMAELTRAQSRELISDIRNEQRTLMAAEREELEQSLEMLSGNEAVWEGELIRMKPADAARAWQQARLRPIQATGQLLLPMIKEELGPKQTIRVEREIAVSIAQGRSLSETVKSINGLKKNNYKDGILGRELRDADAIIRTATQHTSQQGRHATWVANDIERWKFSATLDGKTSVKCRALDRQTFPVGEGPEPPLHIRCRSTTIADIPDPGGTRSSIDGPVSNTTSYYDWLKTQPEKFQDKTIGPARGKLLRDGGLTSDEFAKLQLDKRFDPMTLEEMAAEKPYAFSKAGLDY